MPVRRGRSVRHGFCCLLALVTAVILAGCTDDDEPTDMGGLSYVRLLPSLPSMGRILGGALDYLNDPVVGGSPLESGCTALDESITGPINATGAQAMPSSFRGAQVSFTYAGQDRGDVLAIQSPVQDQSGITHDFMAAVNSYPCSDLLDLGAMPADSAAASNTGTISAVAMVQGLPDGIAGYWYFTTPDVTDPAFTTSRPVSSLGNPGLLDVFTVHDGYLIRVRLEGYSPDASQTQVNLDSVIKLVDAISDRVGENRYTVQAMDSPGSCSEVMGRLLEKNPQTDSFPQCY